jgi:hypothetical protein
MKRLLSVVGLLLAMFAVASLAAEKKPKEDMTVRSVQGQVVDEQEQAVAGAVVHLKNTKTLQIRSFITKDDGSYAFHGLSTNIDYELKADRQNLVSDTKTLSVFDSRHKAVINLKLEKK